MFGLSGDDWTAVALSMRIAAVATAVSFPFGVAVAYTLARWTFPGKALLNAVVHLPLVLPPVVTGYVLLLVFGVRGVLGAGLAQIGVVLAFRWTGAALACAVMGFPLMVRAMRLSFEAVDPRLEAAAGTLGAGPLWRFVIVTLPLAVPGLITGSILAFARSLGEFGATITFVSNIPGETRTIAAAIYTDVQTPEGDAGALRLTLVAIAISLGAVLASDLLQRGLAKRLAA